MTAEKKNRRGRKRTVRDEDRAAHAQVLQGTALQLKAIATITDEPMLWAAVSLVADVEAKFSTKPTPDAA